MCQVFRIDICAENIKCILIKINCKQIIQQNINFPIYEYLI